MREFKFRGLTFKGDWVYGDLTTDFTGLSFDEEQWCRNNLTENSTTNETTGYWQKTTKRIHWYEGNVRFNAPVRPDSVGQCTGMIDKNEVEIYEGDLIQPEYNRLSKFVVNFSDGKYNSSSYNLAKCSVVPAQALEIK